MHGYRINQRFSAPYQLLPDTGPAFLGPGIAPQKQGDEYQQQDDNQSHHAAPPEGFAPCRAQARWRQPCKIRLSHAVRAVHRLRGRGRGGLCLLWLSVPSAKPEMARHCAYLSLVQGRGQSTTDSGLIRRASRAWAWRPAVSDGQADKSGVARLSGFFGRRRLWWWRPAPPSVQ